MSDIFELVERLQETDAAVEQFARFREARPDDDILQVNAAAVAKRRGDLVRRLDHALHANHADLVSYRVERSQSDVYPIKAVAASMTAFQELITAVFDALKTQPKRRFRPSAENVDMSTFAFSGASAGSVILSFSLPNDRLLVGETELDVAFDYVERTLSARATEDLKLLADKVGIAAITKAYSWADNSVAFNLNTRIAWGKTYEGRREIDIPVAEAALIKALIEDKSDTIEESIEVDGILLGHDGATAYFHLETLGERVDIKGTCGQELSRTWTTGRPYHAKLNRETQVRYATGAEVINWTLLALEPIKEPEF